LEDDLEALLAIHRLPVRHRLACRTTNLLSSGASRKNAGD
jgi:hypothetical protein